MLLPPPQAGQVIRYAYLWADEHASGREEGVKDRPAVITMALFTAHQQQRVVVVPITHSLPSADVDALELPRAIKRHLHLDDERSWVILSEINVFTWPGPDLRPVTDVEPATVLYGYLPAGLFRQLRDRLAANIRAGQIRQVPRTE